MKNKDVFILDNIKKSITNKGFNSLVNVGELSKKEKSAIIGIGGSHIYFSSLLGFRIDKSYKAQIDFKDKDNFFEDIIYKYKHSGFENNNTTVIFSYPFSPYTKGDIIDGLYSKDSIVTKIVPFSIESFVISEKLKNDFNVLNDAVAVNLYNIYQNKDYDIYISAISGTGVNISYTKNNKVINSEFGNITIPEELTELNKIYGDSTYEKICAKHSIKKISKIKKIDYKYLKKISEKIFALSIVSFIGESKSASILFQGSFICKDKEYRENVIKIIKKHYKGKLAIDYDNLSDIKGASLI